MHDLLSRISLRIEVDAWEIGMLQGPAQKGFDLLIEALADATHFRFGDAAVVTQRFHYGIHSASRDASGVGLHDHCIETYTGGAALASRGRSCPASVTPSLR